MITQIMLDMDGVLADFVSGAVRAHKRPLPYDDRKNYGIFLLEEAWGISAKEVWAPIDALGENFWLGLEKTPEADALVDLCADAVGIGNVAVLTAPSENRDCVPGKRAWMKKHYPALAKRMIFGSAKEFLTAPNRLLIDDRDKNVDAFRAAGGQAILVPRLWNRSYAMADNTLRVVEIVMDYICPKQ